MRELKYENVEELLKAITRTDRGLSTLASALDRQNNALKEMVFGLALLNKNINELIDKLDNNDKSGLGMSTM